MAQPLTETWTPDDLIASGYPVENQVETILSGETIVRGCLLGRVTASGKLKVSLAAANDGSQKPVFIAAYGMGTLAADTEAEVYKSGGFRLSALTLGAGHTAASVRAAFDGTPIILV